MRTLYVTDLDGTLLNTHDTIGSYSRSIINALVEQGMLFTYATARSLVSASVVTSAKIPVIAYNGAFIFNPLTGESLSSEFFPKEEAAEVKEILSKYNISPLVYSYINNKEKVSWITSKVNNAPVL